MLQKFSDSRNYDTWYPQPFQPVIYSETLFPSPRFLTSSRIVINSWTNVGYEFFSRGCQRHFTNANVLSKRLWCWNVLKVQFEAPAWLERKYFSTSNISSEGHANWNEILSSYRFSSQHLDDRFKSQRKSEAAGTLKAWHLITSWIPSDGSPVVKVMNCPLNCSFIEWQTFLTN